MSHPLGVIDSFNYSLGNRNLSIELTLQCNDRLLGVANRPDQFAVMVTWETQLSALVHRIGQLHPTSYFSRCCTDQSLQGSNSCADASWECLGSAAWRCGRLTAVRPPLTSGKCSTMFSLPVAPTHQHGLFTLYSREKLITSPKHISRELMFPSQQWRQIQVSWSLKLI